MLIPFCPLSDRGLFLSCGLGDLCSVFGTRLSASRYALGVKRAADDVITHTGQVTYTTASDKNDRVLLQVVSFAGNVGRGFKSVGKTHSCDLAKRRVRLLGLVVVTLVHTPRF